jgi:hypothetical protein
MAVAAVLLTGTQAVLAWQIYRHSVLRPLPVATKAVLAGLVLTFMLSTVSGFMLGGQQPPAGSGLPIAGWHLGGGDLRPRAFPGRARPATDSTGRPAAPAPPVRVCSPRPVAGDGHLCGRLGAVGPVRDAGGPVSRRIAPRTNGTAVPSKRGHPLRTSPKTPEQGAQNDRSTLGRRNKSLKIRKRDGFRPRLSRFRRPVPPVPPAQSAARQNRPIHRTHCRASARWLRTGLAGPRGLRTGHAGTDPARCR